MEWCGGGKRPFATQLMLKCKNPAGQSRRRGRARIREKTMSEVHRRDVKKGLFIIFIFFIIFVYQMVNIINYFSEQVAEAREVRSLESLELLWHSQQRVEGHSNGYCGEINRQTYFLQIDAANNQLILPVWGSRFSLISRLYLTAFDLETGETNWKTVIEMDGPSEFRGNSNGIGSTIKSVRIG